MGVATDGSAEPAGKRIQVRGLNLHYLEWGSPSNPPLVLMHGGGQTAYTWGRVAEHLGDRYHMIAPDARGHGESDWSPDGRYGGDTFREDLREMVLALGLERFVLIGMSMGGMTSLAYASRYCESLAGLVVVDISPEVRKEGRDRILGFMRGRDDFASLEDAVEYAHAYNPRRTKDALARTLPQNLRQLPDGRLRWKWDPACFSRTGMTGETRHGDEDLWAAAARIHCPALIVHGKESDILTQDAGERLASVVKNGRYVAIDGSGHGVQGDNPKSLSLALEQFLTEIGY